MKKTSLIRSIFGLSQYDLANLLGVPRSVVNMYERGERDLPLNALVRMANLEIALNKSPVLPQEGDLCVNISHPFFEPGSITGKLQKEVEQSKEAIEKLKEQLLQMRNTYELLKCWVRMLLEGREGDNQEPDIGYEKWLELYMMKLTGRLGVVSPEKQFMLQHLIETKLAAMTVTERALALLAGENLPQQG